MILKQLSEPVKQVNWYTVKYGYTYGMYGSSYYYNIKL